MPTVLVWKNNMLPGGREAKHQKTGRVLRAGCYDTGRWSFWTDHSLVWTPNKVFKFALAAGGAEMTWAEFYPELEKAGVNYGSWGNQRQARDNRYCGTGVDCANKYPLKPGR
jgi:hypothetical protein